MTTLHIIAGLLGLAIALVVMAIGACVYMAHCWSRFEKVNGSYKSAMAVLEAAEHLRGIESLHARMKRYLKTVHSWFKRGMKYAQKQGWLT
jgi:hypothetical protein